MQRYDRLMSCKAEYRNKGERCCEMSQTLHLPTR